MACADKECPHGPEKMGKIYSLSESLLLIGKVARPCDQMMQFLVMEKEPDIHLDVISKII